MSLNPVTRSFLLNALSQLKADLGKAEVEIVRWIDDRIGNLNKDLANGFKEQIAANQEAPVPPEAEPAPADPAQDQKPADPVNEPAPAAAETPAA